MAPGVPGEESSHTPSRVCAVTVTQNSRRRHGDDSGGEEKCRDQLCLPAHHAREGSDPVCNEFIPEGVSAGQVQFSRKVT